MSHLTCHLQSCYLFRIIPHNVAHEFGAFYSSSSAGRLLFWFYAPDNRLRCTPAFRRGVKGMSGALNLALRRYRIQLAFEDASLGE